MTLQDVTSRIATIQQQLAMLAPAAAGTTALASRTALTSGAASATATSTGAAFSQALDGVLAGTTTATSSLPETGSLSDLVAPPSTPGSTASGAAVVERAQTYLGVPYVWGGTDPATGLDCSGLVQRVYRDLGIELPRVSRDQARMGTAVSGLDEAQPGDLLAFGSPVHHIGIYAGGGKMIEAPRTGLDVRVADVSETPSAVRRVIGSDTVTRTATVRTPISVGGLALGTPYADLFTRAAGTYGIDASLLAAVAEQESGFDSAAVSPVGAQGLMQLMPATARSLGVSDSFDPAQAVDGAAKLLSGLLNRFGRTDLALAAYNAGPGAVLRYGGVPPYPETQNYVRSITSALGAGL